MAAHNTVDAQFDVRSLVLFLVLAVLLVAGALYLESRM